MKDGDKVNGGGQGEVLNNTNSFLQSLMNPQISFVQGLQIYNDMVNPKAGTKKIFSALQCARQ